MHALYFFVVKDIDEWRNVHSRFLNEFTKMTFGFLGVVSRMLAM